MSIVKKIKEIERKKIHFGTAPGAMQSAAAQSNICGGLGFSQINPNIHGGFTIYDNGLISGHVNPTVGGGFHVVGNDGSIESIAMPNVMGGFNIYDY